MEKILVTGGAGFIGSAIISELHKQGKEIFVIDNLSFGRREFISQVPDDHFFQVDILDRQLVFDCIRQIRPQYIIHLAAVHFIPYCNQHPFLSANINIQGTVNILDASSESPGVEKFLFASTAAVYPLLNHALNETVELRPSDIYGLSKAAAERVCSEFHLRTGIPTIVCRFFNAFGPNETNPHLIPAIQEQVNNGERHLLLGNLEPKRDYIHTHDMAVAVSRLMEKFNSGFEIFNLGSGEEYSVKEIVAAFEKQLGEPLTIGLDPARVRKSDRLHLLADITRLSQFISWRPKISLDEGIGTLVENRVTH